MRSKIILHFVKDANGQRQIAAGLFESIVRATNGANAPEYWQNADGVQCCTIRTVGVVSGLHALGVSHAKANRKRITKPKRSRLREHKLGVGKLQGNVGKHLHMDSSQMPSTQTPCPKWAKGKLATEQARRKAGKI
jgi:hypothetical protein